MSASPEPNDVIILSVKLQSGRFSSELRVPFPTTEAVRDEAMQQWADLIATGFRVGASEMTVRLKEAT